MPVNEENLKEIIRYHAPTAAQVAGIDEIRAATQKLIGAILSYAPPCADQQAAIRHAREAMMTANAAIVLDGLV